MATKNQTRSEMLFEELCCQQGIEYKRLPVIKDQKQPDYELTLSGVSVVVEVKQIEPNNDDKIFHEALTLKGVASQCRNPDAVAKRVRNHIAKSREQFRSYFRNHPAKPAILVIFDNASNGYTDPYTIQTALHGFERVVFAPPNVSGDMSVVDRGFGPRNNKEISKDKNQHLSALATLHEAYDLDSHERFLALCFYHNKLADHPFSPFWWNGPKIIHYVISEKEMGKYQNWINATAETRDSVVRNGDDNGF